MKKKFVTELSALHDLQSACQVALRDVPHQKGCVYFGKTARAALRAPALCGCILNKIAGLEFSLSESTGFSRSSPEHRRN
jgi:hypothetical protein